MSRAILGDLERDPGGRPSKERRVTTHDLRLLAPRLKAMETLAGQHCAGVSAGPRSLFLFILEPFEGRLKPLLLGALVAPARAFSRRW